MTSNDRGSWATEVSNNVVLKDISSFTEEIETLSTSSTRFQDETLGAMSGETILSYENLLTPAEG